LGWFWQIHHKSKNMPLKKEFKAILKREIERIPIRRIAVWTIIFLITAFLLIALFIAFFSTAEFEAILSRELQEERNPAMDFYMKATSVFGETHVATPMIIGSAILFAVFGYIKEGIFMLFTSVASIINFGIKALVNRQRPTGDLVEILGETSHQSFPSGHTVHYVVFFGMFMILFFQIRKINLWTRLFAALICLFLIFSVPFSRVYLGAHWATDVLAGFIEGVVLLSGLLYLYFRKTHSWNKLNRRGYN